MLPLPARLAFAALALLAPATHAAEPASPAASAPVPDAHLTAPLAVPASGVIRVAFLISPGAEVVDFTGPWGVFEYVAVGEPVRQPFQLYTVAATPDPVTVSGGLTVVPTHTFADAPAPDLVVVPALELDRLAPAALDWLRRVHASTALTFSVCNGSLVLGQAGLLDGKKATAHHGGFAMLRAMFPQTTVVRGVRYVEDGRIATAGGLTSGTDLALRVVERYFGREVAQQTAFRLEYQGTGWMHPASNAAFTARPAVPAGQALCPVCEMPVSRATALHSDHDGTTYYFCSADCQKTFAAHPGRFLEKP
jgi:putative intracellular protease/amidase/YHS domain-containing protein